MLCVLIYNIKLTIMLKYPIIYIYLPCFQLIRRRRANRRGQDEVFGRIVIIVLPCVYVCVCIYVYIYYFYICMQSNL